MLRKFPQGSAPPFAPMLVLVFVLGLAPFARASTLGQVQGVVHDPGHRPIAAAHIVLRAVRSDLSFSATTGADGAFSRAEEHTSELQSHVNLVCRLLLEK